MEFSAMVKKYLSLVKFSHTIFAMPFAMTGLFAGFRDVGGVDWEILILVAMCMIFARNAAMAFNRWLDRDVDALNPRTAVREIPAGVVSARAALIFVALNVAGFVLTTYFINTVCFRLSPVALFVILFYSYTKRFTSLCHGVLGTGLALAPVGAYLAATERFEPAIVLLGVAVLCWVAGFDIIYALQDEEFDRRSGLRSIPSALGYKGALAVARTLHSLTAITLFVAVHLLGGGWMYVGVGGFCAMLARQHYLVHRYKLEKINLAFFTANGLASLFFGLTAIVQFIMDMRG
jgi:4-hydroxybenzoate polyprenyltransferase